MAELTALADESLAPDRRAIIEARVAACSELAERLAEQKRAVALMQNAAGEVAAPVTLRGRVENRSPSRRR
jgi:anti-sigma factor RsiW